MERVTTSICAMVAALYISPEAVAWESSSPDVGRGESPCDVRPDVALISVILPFTNANSVT
jgi:hypothetical protein